MAQKATNSHLHSAMNFSCSLPGKTWFTRNALHWGLFSFLFLFCFVLLVLLAVGATLLHRAQKEVLLHRTAGLGHFCVIYF